MIKFEHIEKLLCDGNYTHVRISDSFNNKLFDLKADSPDKLFALIKEYGTMLSTYEKVAIKAGYTTDQKSNFTNATKWFCSFSNFSEKPQPGQNPGNLPAQANNEILSLQKQMLDFQYKLQYSELERSLKDKYQNDDGLTKYFPLLGMFMDVDDKKLERMLKMSQISGMMNGTLDLSKVKPATLAGTDPTPEITSADTINEKLDIILLKLAENEKIDSGDLLFTLTEINNRPELLKKAVNAIKLKLL